MRVTFLEPKGTFSHEMAVDFFGSNIETIPAIDFHSVINNVISGKADAGTLPFFNSSGKSIIETLQALSPYYGKVMVSAIAPLPIRHNLVVTRNFEFLSKISSKKQVFDQITDWKEQWEQAPKEQSAPSTATALINLLDSSLENQKTTAVICSSLAVQEYGGIIKEPNIQNSGNTTLFLILKKAAEVPKFSERFLIGLTCPDDQCYESALDDFFSVGCFLSGYTSPNFIENLPLLLEFDTQFVKKEKMPLLNEFVAKDTRHYLGTYSQKHSIGSLIEQYF